MRKSRQRDVVFGSVMALRGEHPSADRVYAKARESIPNISLGTVYRNLNVLCDAGRILKIETHDGDRFDCVLEDHAHAICSECGKIFDIPTKRQTALRVAAREAGFFPDSVSTTLSGRCLECSKKE